MGLEMVLNELSLVPAADTRTAHEWMLQFVQTACIATSYGVRPVIRTQAGMDSILLAPGYPIVRWRNDLGVDLETRRFFKSLIGKAPFWEDIPELYQRVQESEFVCNGQIANGLGFAFLLESLAISLPSDEMWHTAWLALMASWLRESGDIEEEQVQVVHASLPEHANEHRGWFSERLRSDIRDGDYLWERREELLPSLRFCASTEGQVRALNEPMLRSVVRRLFELDAYCRVWDSGGFDPDRLPSRATPDSQPTLDQYWQERTLLCPDGVERTFNWHLRLPLNAWRIYFEPEPGARTMFIGHVGPHLQTVKFH